MFLGGVVGGDFVKREYYLLLVVVVLFIGFEYWEVMCGRCFFFGVRLVGSLRY